MLKTIVFFTLFWIFLVPFVPIGLAAYFLRLLGFGATVRSALSAIARFWAALVIRGAGVRLRVEGEDNIPASGGVCFIGNHQGDFDIIIALALIRRPFGFTAKREAAYVPVVGMWVRLLGGVFIDRGNPRKSFRAIEEGARNMRAGGGMIIFPEGTRSRGRGMLPFKPGAFKLATMAGAAIVPVAIDGSWKVWEERHRIRSADVVVRFGKPVPTGGLTIEERRSLPSIVRAEIMRLGNLPEAANG